MINPGNGSPFPGLVLVEKPLRDFPPVFAVCCAHNLFAESEQIPHLQPEKYFLPGTCPGRKCLQLYFLLTQKTLRGFLRIYNPGNGSPFPGSFYTLSFGTATRSAFSRMEKASKYRCSMGIQSSKNFFCRIGSLCRIRLPRTSADTSRNTFRS